MERHSFDYQPKRLRFLVISSRPINHSAGLAADVVNALRQSGHEATFLTHYGPRFKKVAFEYLEHKPIKKLIIDNLVKFAEKGAGKWLRKVYRSVKPSRSMYTANNGITIPYLHEEKLDFQAENLDHVATIRYDAIITIFWQDMLNSTALKIIYDKFNVPILIFSPDMAPLTGGCYYFGDCRKFEHGCGSCPGLCSTNTHDQTAQNYALKKRIFSEIPCCFCGNTWMLEYAKKSKTFSQGALANVAIVLNENDFSPVDDEQIYILRKEFGIASQYTRIILARSSKVERKGAPYIFYAYKNAVLRRREDGVDDTILLTIGDETLLNKCREEKLPCRHLGIVDKSRLISCYRVATCFINASLDDAGPSMINQSILCGTPVVCFDNGTAIDVIHNGISGFKVPTGDGAGLARILTKLLDSPISHLSEIRRTTRIEALAKHSYKAFSDRVTFLIKDGLFNN